MFRDSLSRISAKSYCAAKSEVLPVVEHQQSKGLNNRAENSHQPTRLRERVMEAFTAFDGTSSALLV